MNKNDIVPPIHIFDTLGSTNDTAKEMAAGGAVHGTVVIADGQTAGRGRYGHTFYSPHGSGIYMSVIFEINPGELRPEEFAASGSTGLFDPADFTVSAGEAVCRAALAVCGMSCQIKGVNDVFLGGRKICGILTEAVTDIESGRIGWIVVGVGVNVTTADFPDEISEIAGSIGAEGIKNKLTAAIINELYRRFL